MTRVRIALVAGALLVGTLSVPAAAELPPGGTFVDDQGSVHEPAIEAIAAVGITLGCNPPINDRYCPHTPVSRAQMAALLNRADPRPAANRDHFTDDRGSVFEDDINRIGDAGITKGCNPPANTRFCPGEVVSRAQMASFLTRALGLDPIEPPPPDVAIDALPRSAWGASSPDLSKMHEHTISRLTVHHAGEQWGMIGPERYRAWESLHTGRGWGDIAYHYIIGIDGTVYEARDTRYAGATNTNYDPTGHFLVVVEGNFDKEHPTRAQLDSLVEVLAWAALEFEASPSTIGGHRDHAATSCPGGNLYPYIASGDLQRDVEELISTGG